jgi:hypothetical protein
MLCKTQKCGEEEALGRAPENERERRQEAKSRVTTRSVIEEKMRTYRNRYTWQLAKSDLLVTC